MDTISEMTIKLVLSAFLGGIIGLERETHARAAGLRTHSLVATGSALIITVSNNCSSEVPRAWFRASPKDTS